MTSSSPLRGREDLSVLRYSDGFDLGLREAAEGRPSRLDRTKWHQYAHPGKRGYQDGYDEGAAKWDHDHTKVAANGYTVCPGCGASL